VNMKVFLISGSYQHEFCGIVDYTKKLEKALLDAEIKVTVLANIDWSIKNYKNIVIQIKEANADIIHIQYPSIGYGFSIVPQLLSLRFKTIVTIHEVIFARYIRKVSLMPFSLRAKLIFTNAYEQARYNKLFRWASRASEVIPIGSNIDVIKQIPMERRNTDTIVCFGQIRPQKGIEKVINLAQLIKKANIPYRIKIVGQKLEKFNAYYETIIEQVEDLPIELSINLPEKEVATILADNFIAYFPFPDGASERRGSLFSALINNMLCFSINGRYTSADLKKCFIDVRTPKSFLHYLVNKSKFDLLNSAIDQQKVTAEYLKKLSWSNIAKKHIDLYNFIIQSKM